MNKLSSSWVKWAGVLIFLGIWQSASVLQGTGMLPRVDDVAIKLVEQFASGEMVEHGSSTLLKGLAGLLLALILGTVLGVACAQNRYVDAAVNPLVSLLYPVPKLALYPVVILIFGFGAWSKIVQVALECSFPIFVQMYAGARAVPRNMQWLARNNEARPLLYAKDILLPAMLPYLLTGLRVATPIMLIVMCVTEFIGESKGLGHLIARHSSYFDTASAFAVIVVLGLLGLLADRAIVGMRNKLVFWERGVSI